MIPLCKIFLFRHCRKKTTLFSACMGCNLVPIVGSVNDDSMCVGCRLKKRCRKLLSILAAS